jgi:hypothetical protein
MGGSRPLPNLGVACDPLQMQPGVVAQSPHRLGGLRATPRGDLRPPLNLWWTRSHPVLSPQATPNATRGWLASHPPSHGGNHPISFFHSFFFSFSICLILRVIYVDFDFKLGYLSLLMILTDRKGGFGM